MRRFVLAALLIGLASAGLAQSANELLRASAELLNARPWKVELVGQVAGPGGEPQPADLKVQAVPEARMVRIDFVKPDALADNYLVITPEKVYNYLFLTNQVVVYPRDRARVEGLGFDLSRLGDLQDLEDRHDLTWDAPIAVEFDGRAAWKLTGRPADPETSGFARAVLWLDRESRLPLRSAFYGPEDRVLSDLEWRDFAFTELDPEALVRFPPDAEWIEKR